MREREKPDREEREDRRRRYAGASEADLGHRAQPFKNRKEGKKKTGLKRRETERCQKDKYVSSVSFTEEQLDEGSL